MRVQAPGSSANLGPGFDVLGLAVTRHVWASDEGDGPPCGPDHIARIAYERAGGTGPLWFDFELEPSRGLGFSAAARAAGAYLAYRQQGLAHADAQDATYALVAEIEGHGDNAAPSAYGGTWIIAGDRHHRVPRGVPGQLLFCVPEVETLTDASRACLDPEVPRGDAVFNLGRIALLVAAFYEGRADLLGHATEDRLHQPPRLAACEPARAAHRAALDAGATAAWLSGSGPTVAVVVEPGQRPAVEAALTGIGKVLALDGDLVGAIELA